MTSTQNKDDIDNDDNDCSDDDVDSSDDNNVVDDSGNTKNMEMMATQMTPTTPPGNTGKNTSSAKKYFNICLKLKCLYSAFSASFSSSSLS